MRIPNQTRFLGLCVPAAWVMMIGFSTTFGGCGAEKNHEDRNRIAGLDAGYQGPDEHVQDPEDNYYRHEGLLPAPYCIRNCLPDPGSYPDLPDEAQQALCAQEEEGLEFMPLKLWDFTKDQVARNTYRYDDGTTRLQWPPDPNGLRGNPGVPPDQYITPKGWDPPTSQTNFCGRPGSQAFHFSGGPYNYWGGGIGRAMKCLNAYRSVANSVTNYRGQPHRRLLPNVVNGVGDSSRLPIYDANPEVDKTDKTRRKWVEPYCSDATVVGACDPNQTDPLAQSVCPARDQQYADYLKDNPDSLELVPEAALLGQTLDFSQWQGIAVWARRGPESQDGIRVMVGDKYVDEEISFLQYVLDPKAPRYCENVKICDCAGQFKRCNYAEYWDEGKQSYVATPVSNPSAGTVEPAGFRCFEPGMGDKQPRITGDYDYCGETACNYGELAYQMLDPRFYGRPCTNWTSYTGRTDAYCYNPATDPPPAETYQRCGDYWMAGIKLTTDWHLYLVPFTEMHQQGWAKVSDYLDLTSTSVLRLTWDRGWIDYWIAEVKLYRWKR